MENANTPLPLYNASPRDIAKDYGVTARHITGMASRGEIPGKRLGKIWRFNREEVAAFISKQPVKTP